MPRTQHPSQLSDEHATEASPPPPPPPPEELELLAPELPLLLLPLPELALIPELLAPELPLLVLLP
jgi:hypothetical protein